MTKTLALSAIFGLIVASKAVAVPREADCPLVHPADSKLKFVGASIDQYTDGPPRQPDIDEERKLPDGVVRFITHYASYWFYRDAILICAYSEIRNRRIVKIEDANNIRVPLPGILMRCDGILRENKMPYADDWIRRWCVHEPDL